MLEWFAVSYRKFIKFTCTIKLFIVESSNPKHSRNVRTYPQTDHKDDEIFHKSINSRQVSSCSPSSSPFAYPASTVYQQSQPSIRSVRRPCSRSHSISYRKYTMSKFRTEKISQNSKSRSWFNIKVHFIKMEQAWTPDRVIDWQTCVWRYNKPRCIPDSNWIHEFSQIRLCFSKLMRCSWNSFSQALGLRRQNQHWC
jgi:hypothetical protein